MLLNTKINDEDVKSGDIFKFDFKKLENTSFRGSNISKYIESEKIDDLYVHFLYGVNKMNIIGINLYYLKDGKIEDKQYSDSPSFIQYITSKSTDNVFKKVNNIQDKNLSIEQILDININNVNNSDINIEDIGLGIKDNNGNELKYWDIVKLDYNKVKEINFFKPDFQSILDSKNIEDIYIHLIDLHKIEPKYPTSLEYKVYGVSKRGFENEYSDEENERERLLYEETKSPSFKFNPVLMADFMTPIVIKYLSDKGAISEVVGNKQVNEIEIGDINNKPRKKMKF